MRPGHLRQYFTVVLFGLLSGLAPVRSQPAEETEEERLENHLQEQRTALQDRLTTLIERWQHLPPPQVPSSGRSLEEVILTASSDEGRAARRFFIPLPVTPPEQREVIIRERLAASAPSEVDLWWPLLHVRRETERDSFRAAATIEAWLQWAEALGRQDAIFLAASHGIELLYEKQNPRTLVPLARAWTQLPEAPGADPYQGMLTLVCAQVFYFAGESAEALPLYRRARRFLNTGGNPTVLGHTWLGEANSLSEGSQAALDAYHEASTLFITADDKEGQASTWLGEAGALAYQGRNHEALKAFREARELFVVIESVVGQSDSWDGEGEVHFLLGRHEKALDAFRIAQELAGQAGYAQGQGNALMSVGEVLSFLEENEQALDAFREARGFSVKAEDLLGQGNTWTGEARVLFQLGRNHAALAAYRNARSFFETVEDLSGEGNSWLGESEVLARLELLSDAIAALEEALSCFSAADDQLGQANAWRSQGALFLYLEDPENALGVSTRALESYRAVDDKLGMINALLIAAYAQAVGTDGAAAIPLAEQAARLHEEWRKTTITDRHRIVFDQPVALIYDLLVAFWAHQADAAETLAYAEESRSRVLLDLLVRDPPVAGSEEPPGIAHLAEKRRRLERRLQELEKELAETIDASHRRELKARRHRLDRDLEWNHYQRLAAQGDTLPGSQPLEADAIRELARKIGNPILLYDSGTLGTLGFLILPGREEIVMERIDLDRGDLKEAIDRWSHYLANPLYEERGRDLALNLWNRLFAPFAAVLSSEPTATLTLIPHGPLHRLPFDALLNPDGIPLFEHWHLNVAPSASVLAFARGRHREPRPDDTLLTLRSGKGLSAPVREADEITRLFDRADVLPPLVGRYRQSAGGARHLFIATRGVHQPSSRTGTYLELSRGDGHDSRLSAAEVASIPIDTELVTLAACDTAAGRALLSDERLDLTRAFLIAGAASVLATRWKVPEDRSTSRFLVDFYRAYRTGGPDGKGMRKDEALTFARHLSRQRGDPAQVWAAWVLVGDPR
jgi:CHAT domain-containing protein